MPYLLFIAYFVLASWLVPRVPFFKKAGLSPWWLLGLFWVKIAAGVLYGLYYAQPQYVATSDTWQYYQASLAETDWLLHNPGAFMRDLFYNPYQDSGNLFNNQSSYWNDLKSNSFIKLIAVINLFTGSRYYVNIIFFNFFYFFGPVALFRLAAAYWPWHKAWLAGPVFLLPSFVFWCSGVHKDGLLFSALLLAACCLQRQLACRRLQARHIWCMLLCFGVLFFMRNFLLLLLLPALLCWALAALRPSRKGIIFGGVYALALVLFFTLRYLHPALDFPAYVVAKQAEFSALSGASRVMLPPLHPTFGSFIAFLPYALDMAFLQPHVAAASGITYLLAAAENLLVLLGLTIVGAFLLVRGRQATPFILFLLYFSLSVLLMSGFTVIFSGAIVRYKSIATPLLATAVFLLLASRKRQASGGV